MDFFCKNPELKEKAIWKTGNNAYKQRKKLGEKGLKSQWGKNSEAILTHFLKPNSQADMIILDTLLRSSEKILKLVLLIEGKFLTNVP